MYEKPSDCFDTHFLKEKLSRESLDLIEEIQKCNLDSEVDFFQHAEYSWRDSLPQLSTQLEELVDLYQNIFQEKVIIYFVERNRKFNCHLGCDFFFDILCARYVCVFFYS